MQVKDEGDVYDVIEETDYQMLARDRQKEEFIEDDDHAGYADGDEDWNEHHFSDEYSDGEPRATGKCSWIWQAQVIYCDIRLTRNRTSRPKKKA
jgi:hypothetical protein